MKVYRVEFGNGEPQVTYATKTEALKVARASAKQATQSYDHDETVVVYEDVLVPLTKAAIVDLINVAGGYIADDKVVATFTRKASR